MITVNTIDREEPSVSKWVQLVDILRDRIIDGYWSPGEKLPPYEALLKEFNVSRVTMQQAIGRLKQDGFLNSIERRGLFVNDFPPHKNRIGFVLEADELKNCFLTGLIDSANTIAKKTGIEFIVYRNIGEPYSTEDSLKSLRYDIESKRLGGLLFLFDPLDAVSDYALFCNNDIPKVYFSGDKLNRSINLKLDTYSLVTKALNYLEEQDCKRIAFLYQWQDPPALTYFREEIKKRSLHSPFEWQIPINNQNAKAADNITRLLLSLPEDQRPEGLFIGDDNLTIPAVRGIVASKLDNLEDLTVVSHCNWGEQLPDVIPIEYLGFDTKWIITKCLEAIDGFHQNKDMDERINIPALFAEELTE